jgi:hypothetical protein
MLGVFGLQVLLSVQTISFDILPTARGNRFACSFNSILAIKVELEL